MKKIRIPVAGGILLIEITASLIPYEQKANRKATLVTKTEFAEMCDRSPSAVSNWIKSGILTPASLVGYGQNAKIWLEKAKRDLNKHATEKRTFNARGPYKKVERETKLCAECGRQFQGLKRQKLCSTICRTTWQRKQQSEWMTSNPAKHLEYYRKSASARARARTLIKLEKGIPG